MATIQAGGVLDVLLANNGHYGDDPPVLKIVKYTDAWGKENFGIVYASDDPDRYRETPYVNNPETVFKHQYPCTVCDPKEFIEYANKREELTKEHGQVWSTEEMRKDFTVQGFGGGYCIAIRKADNVRGAFEFTHAPRFYFNFRPA